MIGGAHHKRKLAREKRVLLEIRRERRSGCLGGLVNLYSLFGEEMLSS